MRKFLVALVLAASCAASFVPGSAASAASKGRKSCFSVAARGAVETALPDGRFLKYSLAVTAKYCVFAAVLPGSVTRIEETARVSHTGYLPAPLPRDPVGRARPGVEIVPQGSLSVSSVRWDSSLGRYRGELLPSAPLAVFGRFDALYGDLLEAGFACDASRCRPSKRSVSSKVTLSDVAFLSPSSGARMALSAYLMVPSQTGPGFADHQGVYWDAGVLCSQAAGCSLPVRPVRSFVKFDPMSPVEETLGIPVDAIAW